MRVEISAPHGRLTLSSVVGLEFDIGNGVANDRIIFTGHLGAVNTALRNAIYSGDADWNTLGRVPNAIFIRSSNSHAELGGVEPIAVEAEQKFW